ncbi:MAG: hypothetical protein ACRD2G_06885 [Terriglobia bacterium]
MSHRLPKGEGCDSIVNCLYRRQYVDVTPTIDQRWLMRQLNTVDRSLDRSKVRLMMEQKRMEWQEEIGAKEG